MPARCRRRPPRAAHRSAHRTRALGIAAIYQQPALFPAPHRRGKHRARRCERGSILAPRRLAGAARVGGATCSTASASRIDPDRLVGDAQHARAADRRDRESDRRRRAHRHHGRADRLADRARGGAAVRRHRRLREAGRGHHLHLTSAGGDFGRSPIASPCFATARASPRATHASVDRAELDPPDGRARTVVRLPEAATSRWARRRSSVDQPVHRAQRRSATSPSRCGAGRSSASPGWWAPDAPSSPKSSSA